MKIYYQLRTLLTMILGAAFFTACEKNNDNQISTASSNPKVDKIDPGKGASNEVLILTGSGIGGVTSIYLEKDSIPVSFNPNFNTTTALIMRIPTDAVPGEQHILLTNSSGVSFKMPFNVLGFATITEVSNYNFTAGINITLTGRNMADVSKITLAGTTTDVEIVSKTATSIVLKMPATDLTQTKLEITNEAGPITTTEEFVNVDKAFKIFTEGYDNGFENASWGPAEISTAEAKSGTISFKATYNKGNWSADGFANWSAGLPYSADYKFLSFWVKGASVDYTLYITGDQKEGGSYGNSDQTSPINVKGDVWNYFKIKLSDLQLWKGGATSFKQLGFWIKGPDSQNESFYFDDVILIK
ncbi:MAG: cell shape determination protein CcmA [Chitinophagaceae bacterium]|nr:cell shape determination protein CcmA [Chitinophagaceae bacterium]